MARASSTWTNTDTTLFKGGREANAAFVTDWLVQVLQNEEHLGQSHGHDQDTANDGATLVLGEVAEILWRSF